MYTLDWYKTKEEENSYSNPELWHMSTFATWNTQNCAVDTWFSVSILISDFMPVTDMDSGWSNAHVVYLLPYKSTKANPNPYESIMLRYFNAPTIDDDLSLTSQLFNPELKPFDSQPSH